MLRIISTGYRAKTAEACKYSVLAQRCSYRFKHIYIEASELKDDLGPLGNRDRVIRTLPPDDVVIDLDGDDRLSGDGVLQSIGDDFQDENLWLTWGNFKTTAGRKSFAGPVGLHPRKEPWRATHLKCYRAGLWQCLPVQLLLDKHGKFYHWAGDQAYMLPMLELAGPEHRKFVPEIRYIYNNDSHKHSSYQHVRRR